MDSTYTPEEQRLIDVWEEHLRSRIRAAAAGLDLRVSPEADWSLA